MEKRILFVSSFEGVWMSGDLDTILNNLLNEYVDDRIPGLSKAKLLAELSGLELMSDRSKYFVWDEIHHHNELMQIKNKGRVDVNEVLAFNAISELSDKLNITIGNILKNHGEVRIHTTSSFPNIVYEVLSERIKIPKASKIYIDTIPRGTGIEMARLRSEKIAESEKSAEEKYGKGATHTIFLDGNGSDISRFEIDRSGKGQSFTGIESYMGMFEFALDALDRDIQKQKDITNTDKTTNKLQKILNLLKISAGLKLYPLTPDQVILDGRSMNMKSYTASEEYRNKLVSVMNSNQGQEIDREYSERTDIGTEQQKNTQPEVPDSLVQRKEGKEDVSETSKYSKMSEVKIERKNESSFTKVEKRVRFSDDKEAKQTKRKF